jgi:hypothetical protein
MGDLLRALSKAPPGAETENIFKEIDAVADCQNEPDPDFEMSDTVPKITAEISTLRGQWKSLNTAKPLPTSNTKLYFKHFHIRWPVIHAPTFDEDGTYFPPYINC